ncbi:SDR family oxidoreductase [Weizmannia sp. CD-2023]|uniref:SDR family oxidoreductase n=1 Tax=Weizmannia sp. CD-2023 TaxID=3037263 RepID=UPI002DBEF248|nr:SDR family oxidoreductase [Weizmannia sp. CD-2023]
MIQQLLNKRGSKWLHPPRLAGYTQPEEVANVLLYLASDLSSHIIGQTVVIDGGAVLS